MPRFRYYSRSIHKKMARWWQGNGKVFSLMKLPLELRELIYTYAIGAIVESEVEMQILGEFGFTEKTSPKLSEDRDDRSRRECLATRSVTFSHPLLRQQEHDCCLSAPELCLLQGPAYQLFLTSKQVHSEANRVFAQLITCRFRGDRGFTRYGQKKTRTTTWLSGMHKHPWSRNVLSPHWYHPPQSNMFRFNASLPAHQGSIEIPLDIPSFGPLRTFLVGFAFEYLRRIQLYYTNLEYCLFLGFLFHEGTEEDLQTTVSIRELCQLPSLQCVDFRFAHPSDPMPNSEWLLEETKMIYSCQKAFVDWFFTVALEHLRHCHDVHFSISGCVKDSTRRKWEGVFEDENLRHVHDIEEIDHQQRSRYLLESTWDKEQL
jgi:hypothetical protein